MVLEGGENINYNASTTIRMKPQPWQVISGVRRGSLSAEVEQYKKLSGIELTDESTLRYLESKCDFHMENNRPKEASKFFSLTIKLMTLSIIKKHCL